MANALDEDDAAVTGCDRGFTREMRPVCGSDGEIYNNPSIFKYHQCVKKHKGEQLTLEPMRHCDPAFDDTDDL